MTETLWREVEMYKNMQTEYCYATSINDIQEILIQDSAHKIYTICNL